MAQDLQKGRELFEKMMDRSDVLMLSYLGTQKMTEFDDNLLRGLPAIKIPSVDLSIRECELLVKFIAKGSSESNNFDTLGHLAWLAFNTVLDWVPQHMRNEHKTSLVPFFHKYQYYREEWLTISKTSNLVSDFTLDRLAEMDAAGKFDSIDFELSQKTGLSIYKRMADIGVWAVNHLLVLTKDRVQMEQYLSKSERLQLRTKFAYFHSSELAYRFPKLTFKDIPRPPYGELLYILLRGAIIYENIKGEPDMDPQRNVLAMLAFENLRFHGMTIAGLIPKILDNYGLDLEDLYVKLLDTIPDKWAHLLDTLEVFIMFYTRYLKDPTRVTKNRKYFMYARLFDPKYYRILRNNNNELLLSILIEIYISYYNYQPRTYSLTGPEFDEARCFGREIGKQFQLNLPLKQSSSSE